MQTKAHAVSWEGLAALPNPSKLGSGDYVNIIDPALDVEVVLSPTSQGDQQFGDLALGIARWSQEAARWIAVASQTVSRQIPAVVARAFTLTFGVVANPAAPSVGQVIPQLPAYNGLPPGIYVLLNLDSSPDIDKTIVVPFNPAAGRPSSSGFYQDFTADNGGNAAPSSLAGGWKSTDALGPAVKLPVSRNLELTFSADYDGGSVYVQGSRFGRPTYEVVTAVAGSKVPTKNVYDEISQLALITPGTKGTIDVGLGAMLGLRSIPAGTIVLYVDDALAAQSEYKQADGAIVLAAAKIPDGKRIYRVIG